MNRKELSEKLSEIMAEVEAVYKKHGCTGLFVVYHPGESGHVVGEGRKSGYQHEGQGGVGTVFTADYSVVKRLSEVSPMSPDDAMFMALAVHRRRRAAEGPPN